MRDLHRAVVSCYRCPRLVQYREEVAKTKRKQFEEWNYWAKPIPGFGDPDAKIVFVGLAPAAHGGNRTGRVFTGDKSGDFLMKCLYEVGLANQPTSNSRDDGLKLNNVYITPVLKCVPPNDKPLFVELRNCSFFFNSELLLINQTKCIVALGKIAFEGCLKFWRKRFDFRLMDYSFGHGKIYKFQNDVFLVSCYHPSPRNVYTGRLTQDQMISLLEKVKKIAH